MCATECNAEVGGSVLHSVAHILYRMLHGSYNSMYHIAGYAVYKYKHETSASSTGFQLVSHTV